MNNSTFSQGNAASPEDLSSYQVDPRFAYLEWLHMEARLLRIELYPGMTPDLEYTPCNTFAKSFHFPADERWQDVEPPSRRAERVLSAAGVVVPA